MSPDPVTRSAILARIECPCCGKPVQLKTDKRGRAYLHCGSWRQDEAGTVYPCHFHAKWGARDSAELVKLHLGEGASDRPSADAANSPHPPKPARDFAQSDRTETESEPTDVHEPCQSDPHSERNTPAADADDDGGFLGS